MDARVLLPAGYDPAKRYPVLYLFHGSLGQAPDWLEQGDAERIVGDRELIVVMADGGRASSFSDWYGTVAGPGRRRARTGRASTWTSWSRTSTPPSPRSTTRRAASSRGSRRAATARSSTPPRTPASSARRASSRARSTPRSATRSTRPRARRVWLITLDPANGPLAHCTWGDFVAQQVVWRDNNPTYLAENLEGTRPVPHVRRRQPGRARRGGRGLRRRRVDDLPDEPGAEDRARRRGRAATPPTSTAPARTRGRTGSATSSASSTWLDPKIGQPVEAPAAFDVRSAREEFSAWGWTFRPRARHARVRLPGGRVQGGPDRHGQRHARRDHAAALPGRRDLRGGRRAGPRPTTRAASLQRRPRPEPPGAAGPVRRRRDRRLDDEAGRDRPVRVIRRALILALLARALPAGASAAGPAPLSADASKPSLESTYGSGNFGRWGVDADGLPTYRYELDHMTDPRGADPRDPEPPPRAAPDRQRQHRRRMACNDGYTMLWSQTRLMQLANTWEADNFHWAGGYGYLRTDDGKVLSTLYLDRPQGSRVRPRLRHSATTASACAPRGSRCARTPTRRSATTRCCCTTCRSRTSPTASGRSAGSSTGT